jgi:hypothetical protein
MKKFMICSMMCLMALAAKAQVLTSATVDHAYLNAIKESGDKFAYEKEHNDNGDITTMFVYQKKTRRKGAVDLKPVCRYQYVYTADGLLSSCTKSVWRKGDWQQSGRHAYTLAENAYTVEFSLWNKKKADYDLPLGRMTYTLRPNESTESIACYYRHHKNAPLELEWEVVTECQPINMDNYLTDVNR